MTFDQSKPVVEPHQLKHILSPMRINNKFIENNPLSHKFHLLAPNVLILLTLSEGDILKSNALFTQYRIEILQNTPVS